MKKEDFEKLKYFSYDEKDYKGQYIFHNPEVLKMTKFELIQKLDIIREEMGYPIILHCTYEKSGHTKNSYHYKGMAADFHFKTELDFLKQINILLSVIKKFKTYGLGAYFDWKHKGFHFDIRKNKISKWVRINGRYIEFERGILLFESKNN